MMKKKILAIDDSVIALKQLQNILEKKFEFVGATSGLAGLKRLDAEEFDLVLLDIEMPVMDVVVPVDRIAEFLVYCHDEAEAQGLTLRSFGHAGDGNLHIYCCSNDLELDEFNRRTKIVMDKCYAKCAEFEGQVSGEHAIGHAKKDYLRQSVGETAYGFMSAIKQVFDPKGILNPGKVCHDI